MEIYGDMFEVASVEKPQLPESREPGEQRTRDQSQGVE
jgi:hypothetical protein